MKLLINSSLQALLLCSAPVILTTAWAVPVNPPTVDTCLDSPAVKAGAGYSACKKIGAGPKYNTDMVRVQSPTGQDFESWATLAPARIVCLWQVNAPCAWTAKSKTGVNPPAPPGTPIPPPPTTKPETLTWNPPKANVDGTPIVNSLSYNVYMNGTKIASGVAVLSYTTVGLSLGNYSFYITAVESGVESSPSGTVSVTVALPPAPTPANPNPPSGLMIHLN